MDTSWSYYTCCAQLLSIIVTAETACNHCLTTHLARQQIPIPCSQRLAIAKMLSPAQSFFPKNLNSHEQAVDTPPSVRSLTPPSHSPIILPLRRLTKVPKHHPRELEEHTTTHDEEEDVYIIPTVSKSSIVLLLSFSVRL